MLCYYAIIDLVLLQTKAIESTLAALQDDNNNSLPPLMNPAILEASDDLTSLSHLNEPAGRCGASLLDASTSLNHPQCFRLSSCGTPRKRYIHTVGSS